MSRALPASARRAFTLLEVVIALGILAVGTMVLVDSQATALWMTVDGGRTATASRLAHEKMMEVQLQVEREGFGEADLEEEGSFDDFGDEDFRGESLRLDLGEELSDFHWAWTVRKIDLTLPTDMGGMKDELVGNGYYGDQASEAMEQQEDATAGFDLTDLGITPDMITEYLGNYIREVRVVVWWGENEDETDQVELVTHVINPSGVVTTEDDGSSQ
jgi:prepilin-type N-terminal cleavage/methylation domain-containing protein